MLSSEEAWPLWAMAVGVAVPLVAVLVACVCCRKTVPKNELLGLPGMVKITNCEENLNHNQHSNETDACTVIGSGVSCADTTESNKRASTTANRSLPDIPVDSERIQLESGETLWESNETNGDTSSELYATVEENKHVAQPLATRVTTGASQKCSVQDSVMDESKSSEHSSLSQTEYSISPYARLRAEHPYDKLRSEHPYARVGANNVLDNTIYDLTLGYGNRDSVQSEDSQLLRPTTSGDSTPRPLSYHAGTSPNPVPPPRTRKSSSHNSLLLAPSATLLQSSVPNIQAATAIAGWVSANQELPYMTPPIPAPEMNPPQQEQVNFSGDSQDSKGYTSISVREPLANIKAQTKVASQRSRTQELVDSHYATVSDDSDEMYAAIDEPGQVYTSGSETYAQIQPLALLEVNPEMGSDSSHYPPQPPSVDSLKQVAQVHSRQASSSSAASSVANLGSPKPEKRQANSPLPPPPASNPDLYAVVDKKSSTGLAVSRNLEEMYAKVMKKKQRGVVPDMDQGRSSGPSTLEHTDNLSHASIDTTSSQGSAELRTQQEADGISPCSSDLDSVVGLVSATRQLDPGYEVLNGSPSQQFVDPNYESLGGPSSIDTCYHDPGYEVVQQHLSDCDPNYEELRPQSRDSPVSNLRESSDHTDSEICPEEASTNKNGKNVDPGYEQVKSGARQIPVKNESGPHSLERLDPGYEQVRSTVQEMRCMSVNNNCGSVSQGAKSSAEAYYASVVRDKSAVQSDPGYEQVRSVNGNDDATSRHSNSSEEHDPGYDQVTLQDRCSDLYFNIMRDSQKQLMGAQPTYERVHSKGSSDADMYSGSEPDCMSVDRNRDPSDDTAEPDYESMSSKGQDMLSGMADDPNYESVSYFDLPCDPPYERLHNETRDSDGNSSGYEKVQDHSDLPVGGTDEKQPTGSYLEPGYEEVGVRWNVVNGDSDACCNSSSSIELPLPDRSLHLKEGNGNLCEPQLQTSPTRM